MYKYSFLFVFICGFTFALSAQNQKYHKAKVSLVDKNPLLLMKAGISLDHGKLAIGRYFESDFSDQELNAIRQMGFEVTININDVESYYANPDRPSSFEGISGNERTNDCTEKLFDYDTPTNYFEGSMGGYFTYDEMVIILEWMHTTYPNLISKIDTIKGYKTTDGNSILYLRVSDNPNADEDEPEVLYTALHHAREPNSLSQMIFYLWYLLENYESNPEIKYLVNNTEMYFVPCVNPDGYKLNEKTKPQGGGMWRKNTRKDNTGKVVGVDLNRNYGFEWGFDDVGSSIDPNSNTYRGTSAFSEVETSAIREFCVAHNFILALNYHTYGNFLVHPWGYNDKPTDEDLLFKNMGSIMNAENNFKMGTGTETVGYTVNGDSDDYMYGDQIEKNKIYSYTPEVGPSFWPAKKDIDYLNKSCMKVNLSLPRLVNALIEHKQVIKPENYALIDTLAIEFSKASFKKESVNVSLSMDPIYSNSPVVKQSIDLKQGEKMILNLPFKIKEENLVIGKTEVKIWITKEYIGYTTVDSVYLNFFKGDSDSIFIENGNNIAQWNQLTKWNITSIPEYFVSAPSSITDSPSASYGRNTTNTLVLKSGLDLTTAVNPLLTFKARWNIEKSFDYASLYVCTPGKDTVWLCGKYTNPGTLDQKAGYPIYDGEQNSFVSEIISLDQFVGKKDLYLALEIVSDGFLEMEGFYIDDIEVLSFKKIETSANEESNDNLTIYPNPSTGLLSINGNFNDAQFNLYDFMGRKVMTAYVSDGNTIDCSKLTNGLYLAKVSTSTGKEYVNNVVIAK